jgi:PAS domain S-box-containing protein
MTRPLSDDTPARQQRLRLPRRAEAAVITVDDTGRILHWSRAARESLGYEAAEVKGRNLARLLDPATAERQLAELTRAVAELSAEAAPVHLTARHKDGTPCELEVAIERWAWEGETYFNAVFSGRARSAPTAQTYDDIFIAVTDILARSDRFETAVPLLLRAVAQAIGWDSAAIWMTDRAGKILTCRHFWPESGGLMTPFRDATMSLAFLPGVGLAGRVWAGGESVWLEDVPSASGFIRGASADESDVVTTLAFPIVTGREIIGVIELHSSQRRSRDPALLQLVSHVGSHIGLFIEREAATEALRQSEETYRDLLRELARKLIADDEERPNLQRQLEETRRLSSLGRLAATMAHEFNNMLMGVGSSVELLRRRVVDADAQAAVGRIQQSLTRGRRITSEILRFTRDATPQLATVDVRRWLRNFLPEAAALTNDRVRLEAGDSLYIRGDVSQLNQVLANLLLNARDASGDQSPIAIVVRRAPPELSGLAAEALDLAVIDEGSGIPAEIRDRIFEPLFTTKGHGTGLGLAVVQQVVSAHGGIVQVRSEVGRGTEFHVLLPLAEATRFDGLPDDVVVGSADEKFLRECTDLLAMSGVRVRALQHGVEVLIDVELAPPDALILDLTLARGGDGEGRLDLTHRWPELPVVFLAAEAGEAEPVELEARKRVAVLRKPVTAEEVVSTLRGLMRRE